MFQEKNSQACSHVLRYGGANNILRGQDIFWAPPKRFGGTSPNAPSWLRASKQHSWIIEYQFITRTYASCGSDAETNDGMMKQNTPNPCCTGSETFEN